MTYELYFHPDALKEWKKLSGDTKTQFKKALAKRLKKPHVPSAKLHGKLKDCYKIKLRSIGYRLVYKVDDNKLIIIVLAVGRRNNNLVYTTAENRDEK